MMRRKPDIIHDTIPPGTPPITEPLLRVVAKVTGNYRVQELPTSLTFELEQGWQVSMVVVNGRLVFAIRHTSGDGVIVREVPIHVHELPPTWGEVYFTTSEIEGILHRSIS